MNWPFFGFAGVAPERMNSVVMMPESVIQEGWPQHSRRTYMDQNGRKLATEDPNGPSIWSILMQIWFGQGQDAFDQDKDRNLHFGEFSPLDFSKSL